MASQGWCGCHAHGLAWLRHNIDEVGMFEHLLPPIYRKATGLDE
jgi:hypothetical protein